MNLDTFKQKPLLSILRGIDINMIEPLVDIVIASGLYAIEITMNTENAPKLISTMKKYANGKLSVGAGTVLNMNDLDLALKAGAEFIVSPILDKDVIGYCAKNNIPNFPGAYTPQEVYNAWNEGATMVKIFPVKFQGHEYIKELKGPLNKIEMLACGGINAENITKFFEAGASAVAFGGEVFKKEWLAKNEYTKIQEYLCLIAKKEA